jgi:hypothetical protein
LPGVVLLISPPCLAAASFAKLFAGWNADLHAHQITIILMIYGFIASVLPVWLLLEPRDYLSTYVKLGTIALLIIGIFVVHPQMQFPAFTQYIHGGGPIIKGKLFPVPVRHHCLRRHLRVSLADRFRHHAQDAGQGNGRALHRLRRHDGERLVACWR